MNTFSFFDLQTQFPDLRDRAEDLFLKSEPIEFLEQFRDENGIEVYQVKSGEKIYQVGRIFDFAACKCRYFEFNATCKHIAVIFAPLCRECHKQITERGKCANCEITTAPYLHTFQSKPVERIGGIRI